MLLRLKDLEKVRVGSLLSLVANTRLNSPETSEVIE